MPYRAKEPFQAVPDRLQISHLAFPYYPTIPAHLAQADSMRGVSLAVAGQLGDPVFGPRFRNRRILAAGMSMPKASVDMNDLPTGAEDDVGGSWQCPTVNSETISLSMEQ